MFGYLTGRGVPQLRIALAGYLNRVRGAVAEPDHMVICTGYAQGVRLLVGVLAPRARDGWRWRTRPPGTMPSGRTGGRLKVVGIPVDSDGIRVDVLRDSGAEAVILTPSHQWPAGSVLSARNRAEVIG